jgi:hypothetical protein
VRSLPRFEQIPDILNAGVHDYSIILFGYEDPEAKPNHCGTGTLVRFKNNHYILTASHCAALLGKYKHIAIPVRPGHPLFIQSLPPIYVGESRDKPWGPDLAFVPIHAVDVRQLNAISRDKVFYNLGRHQSQILAERPVIANNIWALVGAPDKLTRLTGPRQLELHLMSYQSESDAASSERRI